MTEIKKALDKNLEKKFEVKVSANEIDEEVDREALKQQPKIKIDGFRKGKVPVDFIKNKYSALLLSDAAENIVEKNVSKLIKENNYNLITRPKINIKTLEAGKDFEFEITFELYPEIPDIKYDRIKLKRQKVKIERKDVEEGKKRLLKSRAKWKEEAKEYEAKSGDRVRIDFLGKLNGEPFDGGKAEGYNLELGSKSFIDTFEDQLIGKKAGDEVDVKVTFPKDYHKKELAGQPAVFEVKVLSVSTPELPELTDEFVKENFNVDNISKLEEMIERELSTTYNSISRDAIKNEIFRWLKQNVKIELPESIIKHEFDRQWALVEKDLKNNPSRFKDDADKEKERSEVKQNAEDSVKLGLILSEIGKKNNINVQDTEIIEEIRKRAGLYPGQEQMIVDFYTKNKNATNQITGSILENKVIDFICQQANVEEVVVGMDDFVKQAKVDLD